MFVTVALCGLIFEAVAFSDFDGAWADDLAMLERGGGAAGAGSGGGSVSTPPPNIVFLFDSSGSMNNLICEDYSGSDECDSGTLTARAAPNSAKVCASSILAALTGPDITGDGVPDAYRGAFASDGVTWQGIYPMFDARKAGPTDDYFPPWTTLNHSDNDPWTTREAGSGGTDQAMIEDVIAKECATHPDCAKKSRCIYSLRTQGYFWESSTCSTGDPMNICAVAAIGGLGAPCTQDTECAGALECENCVCSTCDSDADCLGWTNVCQRSAKCGHYFCDDTESCSVAAPCTAFTAGTLGACCASDGDCTGSYECENGVCSTCDHDDDCSGTGNNCVTTSQCTHYYCGTTETCQVYPTGGLGAACSSDADCNASYVCNSTSNTCSECKNSGGCSGGSNTCVNTSCAHFFCSESGACNPGLGGTVLPSCIGSGTATDKVFLADFLNFYPPKSITLIKAFFDTVSNMTGDARMGVSDFNDVDSGDIAFDVKPPCSQSTGTNCFDGDPATVCFTPSNAQLENYLYNTLVFNGRTPLARALDNAGAYFTEDNGVDTPICDYGTVSGVCGEGNNFVILISDGYPSSDASSASQVPHSNDNISGFSDSYFADNDEFVDDVAKALTIIDHRDFDDDQTVATFTVSFGQLNPSDPSKCVGLMDTTATAGDGRCLPANSVAELRSALTDILNDILKRTRGFTAPATSTTRYSSTAYLSSAVFRPSITFPLWEGHVYGLEVCDENLGSDCNCDDVGTDVDVCVLDADGNEVEYDKDGNMESTPFWDAQICLSKDPNDPPPAGLGPDKSGLDTGDPGCYLSPANRNIFTAVDTSGDGNLTIDDTKIAFTTANVTAVGELLTALNTGGNVAAAEQVVSFYRGIDTGDFDGDGDRTEDRNLATMVDASSELVDGWWVLGDIFHSIPNVVERPTGRGLAGWAKRASYEEFMSDNSSRIKAMLVGANDGMVHAFHTGAWDATDEEYDQGLGKELWAFVSPEMLPELKNLCDPSTGGCGVGEHRYMVDGSVMVRDIWIGGTADKSDTSNSSLWKTVAIFGHRRGGTTYVGLDVTDIENPKFLWQFPQPGSAEEPLVAQTWLDTFPAPASIGPLYVESASGDKYDEWVALLSGGYDPTDATGNALFILNAYTGEKIWGVTETATGADTDDMKYSFPATPVFYSRVDGISPYIAGIVAADHGGQIWHIPVTGVVNRTTPVLTPELIFRAVSPLIAPDGNGGDNDGEVETSEYQTRSFFFAPTLTRSQGQVRVIIGTGDRDHLIPQGTLSPTDGSLGTKCTSDADCATGLECDASNGRCSECDADNPDCSGSCERTDTTCLHSYCDDSSCTVEVDAVALDPDVNDQICNEEQRLYSIIVRRCPNASGGTRPCTDSDLHEVTIDVATPSNSSYSSAGQVGWYYVLEPGEKVATPFEILAGYAMYTTFYPTAGCGRVTDVCAADSMGEARLYARHYVTGRILDWDVDGTITAEEAVVSLGSGVPTAPAVSVAIDGNTATPSLMVGGSDSGLEARTAAGLSMQMATEILRFPVSKRMHDVLHQ